MREVNVSMCVIVGLEPCECKDEVEREEAQALAAAMDRSSVSQDMLPHIPGLSRELSETTITIHVQDEVRCFLVLFGYVFCQLTHTMFTFSSSSSSSIFSDV